MLQQIGQTVTVVRDTPDGQTRRDVLTSIQGRKGYFNVDTDLEEGDLIEQTVPGGKVVVNRVTDVTHNIGPAHFQGNHIEAALVKATRAPQIGAARGPEALRILYLTAAPRSDLRLAGQPHFVTLVERRGSCEQVISLCVTLSTRNARTADQGKRKSGLEVRLYY
jgi:hypothetical protein